ncbi:MAG: deoxyribose-phosphate aldolase [Parachlamydia sp.]|nr:deoxyribose-phosphate aldolase [Parachlamydia sp.]
MSQLHSYIDHTLLKPEATDREIEKLCLEALQYGFASVCVLPVWVKLAYSLLQDRCKVCSVVGFPLGGNISQIKAQEAGQLVQDGASEIDMVISIGLLKSDRWADVRQDIQAVVKASQPAIVKVILETCLLSDEEKRIACRLSLEAGAHFVKTSTGFSKAGATLHDIALMREIVGPSFGVKASGGIRDRATALAMIDAGANRLGTSSGVTIILDKR